MPRKKRMWIGTAFGRASFERPALEVLVLSVVRDHTDRALARPMTNLGDRLTRDAIARDPRLEPVRQALRGVGLFDEEGVECTLKGVVSRLYTPFVREHARDTGREEHLPPWTRGELSVCSPPDPDQ